MIERTGYNLRTQMQQTLSSNNLKIKTSAQSNINQDNYVSPKLFTPLPPSKRPELVNESFKIKKLNMVPIKNFNFQDKLNNLLNI